MKRVVVLGASGMLGNMVYSYLSDIAEERNYKVVGSARDKKFMPDGGFLFNPTDPHTWANIPLAAYYINCIGIINVHVSKDIKNAIVVNSLLPHMLADRFENVIHITTDCVFSGREGNYDENSLHDAIDDYGKTKSLGEPKNCMVIRTSIVGPEIHNDSSLIAWVRKQAGKDINGYMNHYWNGITTLQYAKVCDQIINEGLYKKDLYHVISPRKVTKYELVSMISDHYDVGAIIHPFRPPTKVDRTMATVKDLCGKLNIPEIRDQIEQL
jgi:dTDP-4-dehydrorhamnose reductase